MPPSSLFAALLLWLAFSCLSSLGADRPNFIVVFCDNLGYGDIEPFGSTLHRTPNLNRMAAEGRKFTHFCVTAGVCTPSRASLMTGCYAQRVGMHTNERDGWVLRPVSPYGLNPDEVTIAESLKEQGYATAIIGKWHLGDQPEFLPTRQGFDYFYGIPYSDDMTARTWTDGSEWPPLPLMVNEEVVEAPCNRDGLTKRYTEEALKWLDQHQEEPFFLYFPQAMPGSTRTPFASPQFKGKSRNGPWGDAIEELDWSMGMLLNRLEELGIADNTIVIWTSDNGAPLLPDPADLSRGSNLPLHGRGYTTAEGAFRVPTIAWQPGRVPAGTTCNQLATTMDLLPTFTKLAGGTGPTNRKIDGHDISHLLFGENGESPYEEFFYYHQDELQAVRSGPWKLFLPQTGPTATKRRHPHFKTTGSDEPLLFNVVTDVACQQNVAADHPELVAKLSAIAEQGRMDLGDRNRVGAGQRPIGKIESEPHPQRLAASALDVIEGVRGGRHWANAETAPPSTPQASLTSFEIESGYRIELVASEPLVRDPVAIAFDELGRLFVVEYGDYPSGPPAGSPPLSKVVLLRDKDGDGIADERQVFADKLDFAHSLMPFRGGWLIGAKTEILFLKDTDGDDVADVREPLFDGFTPAHPQMQIGNPRWGLDNWIYFNYGPGKVRSISKETKQAEERVTLPRKDFRFHPMTMAFEPDSGMGQFGNTIDRWGQRFYCTNRNPILTTFLPPHVLARNPFHVVAKPSYDVGKAGGETKVFPLIAMKSNYLEHAGTHTSACGTTAYLGDLGDANFANSLFVCEPIGHLVTRSIVQRDGVRLTARRAQDQQDFIASRDPWFRPASLATGPDGGLYLADMYRLWVEHPKFLPPEIAAKLDWRAGEDRGRIYRIVPNGSELRPFEPATSMEARVALLEDDNAWRQFLGHRLLVENQDVLAGEPLRSLLARTDKATAKLHALWVLEGLELLEPSDLVPFFADDSHRVREAAIQLATSRIASDALLPLVVARANDPDLRVRMQAALALSGSLDSSATQTLAELALRDGSDPHFANALLTSVKGRAGEILAKCIATLGDVENGKNNREEELVLNVSGARLLTQLAAIAGARGDLTELRSVLNLVGSQTASKDDWWKPSVVTGLGQGLPRYRGPLGRLSLASLLSKPPAALEESAQQLQAVFESAKHQAADEGRDIASRVASVGLLAHLPFAETRESLQPLIQANQPEAIQAAAILAITSSRSPAITELLVSEWRHLGAPVRDVALTFLMRSETSIQAMLAAMEKEQIRTSVLSIDQRVRLLKHSQTPIREKAIQLFGGAVSSNRKKVAEQYKVALTSPASVAKGKQVFRRVCAACHQLDGFGFQAGPSLDDVQNRSKSALLYDILDPNSKVEPRFTSYTILTHDDTLLTGLITSETPEAIVFRMAEGKQKTIGRAEIAQINASEVSLMPEGIEKEVSPQEMADLLHYLTQRK